MKFGAATKCRRVEPLRQRRIVRVCRTRCGSGRCPPTPVLATSRDIVTVNGTPLRKIRIPCNCHPPSRPFVNRLALAEQRLALAERQFVAEAEREAVRHLVFGRPLLKGVASAGGRRVACSRDSSRTCTTSAARARAESRLSNLACMA